MQNIKLISVCSVSSIVLMLMNVQYFTRIFTHLNIWIRLVVCRNLFDIFCFMLIVLFFCERLNIKLNFVDTAELDIEFPSLSFFRLSHFGNMLFSNHKDANFMSAYM